MASDFISVATHEMGHALGFTSNVAQTTTNASRPANADLFRYKNGVWDITWDGKPYFSINGGATEFLGNAGFSAGPDGYQTSHWREGARIHDGTSCTQLREPQVGILDPTGGLCQEGIVTAQDLAIFDAMGWNLNQDILQNPTYAKTTSSILQDYLNSVATVPGAFELGDDGAGLRLCGRGDAPSPPRHRDVRLMCIAPPGQSSGGAAKARAAVAALPLLLLLAAAPSTSGPPGPAQPPPPSAYPRLSRETAGTIRHASATPIVSCRRTSAPAKLARRRAGGVRNRLLRRKGCRPTGTGLQYTSPEP